MESKLRIIIASFIFLALLSMPLMVFAAEETNGGSDYDIDLGCPGTIEVDVDAALDWVTWNFDFPSDWRSDTQIGLALIIAVDGEGEGPAFQIHNNDGTDANFDWGTWLYSPWGPEITDGWNGWHSGTNNTPVADLPWVEATGERAVGDNLAGGFTISILNSYLPSDIHWAAHSKVTIPGSGNFQAFTPDDFGWRNAIVGATNYHSLNIPQPSLPPNLFGDGNFGISVNLEDYGLFQQWHEDFLRRKQQGNTAYSGQGN